MTTPDQPQYADDSGIPPSDPPSDPPSHGEPSAWAAPEPISAEPPVDQAPAVAYPPPGGFPQAETPQAETPQAYPPLGYPQLGYPQSGYPQPGYAPAGYAPPGYPPPGYAPPGYAPPGYAPPGYAPPGYAPPGYPQPGYAPAGYAPAAYAPLGYAPPAHPPTSYQPGGYAQPYLTDPAQPLYYDPSGPAPYMQNAGKRMSTGVKVLLWVMPVLLVALVTFLVVTINRIDDANQPTASSPTAGVTGGSAPITAATPTKAPGLDSFTMTGEALGMNESIDKAQLDLVKTLQDTMDSAMKSSNASPSSAAIYQDTVNKQRILMVVAIPVRIANPAAAAAGAFTGFSTAATLQPTKAYPAGAMGGTLLCADGVQHVAGIPNPVPLAVCVVADNGGLLLMLNYDQTAVAFAPQVVALRFVIETQ